jgi:hypothetical protein
MPGCCFLALLKTVMLMRVAKQMACRGCSRLVVVVRLDSCSNAPAGHGSTVMGRWGSDHQDDTQVAVELSSLCHALATGMMETRQGFV